MSPDEGAIAAARTEGTDRSSVGLRLRDRYRIVAPLNRGTLGEVAVAEDEVTGERVAVRLLPRELSAEAIHRNRRSIIAASAAHPAFVRVLDFGEAPDGRSFMVMELAEGQGLNELFTEREPLEIQDGVRLALDVGGAIETLHNLGIAHGGLRPRNVRILPAGRVKLMDLEVAGLRAASALRQLVTDGTPAESLAPEQIRGEPVSDKTDVYAFGLLVYELLCGAPPFSSASRDATLTAQLSAAPPRMRRRRRGIPSRIPAIIGRALHKQPEARPFMSNLLNDLDDAASRPVTSWKRVAAIVGGILVLTSMAIPFMWDVLAPEHDAGRSPAPTLAPLPSPVPPPPVTTSAPTAPEPAVTPNAPGPAATPTAPEPASVTPPPAPSPAVAPVLPLPPPPSPPTPRIAPVLPPPAAPAPPALRVPPPPTVAPTTPPTPKTTPPTPERRPPASARDDARQSPERSAAQPRPPKPAPESSAPDRPVVTPGRPAGTPPSDDSDGGAAIDWLLKRPGAGGR